MFYFTILYRAVKYVVFASSFSNACKMLGVPSYDCICTRVDKFNYILRG